MRHRPPNLSAWLLIVVLLLCFFGLVMLLSISGPHGEVKHDSSFFFVIRQGMFLLGGWVLFAIAARTDYRFWFRFIWILYAVTLLLLILVYIKPIGQNINGSSRWIRFPGIPVQFQPSELAKLSALLFLAHWFGERHTAWPGFFKGFVVPGFVLAVMLVLILAEVDFGATLLIASSSAAMFLAAGAPILWLLPLAGAGAAGIAFLVSQHPERMGRIIAFLEPEKYASGAAYQLINALYGFVAGGFSGLGLGRGLQKQRYLPEAHTDFIYACIGEELGLLATLAIIVLFVLFLLVGLRIAARSADRRGQLLAFGITTLITLQALINIGVVTGCLPTKGLSLPFISYGGSGLLVLLFMAGLLFNIANHPDPASEDA